MCIKVILIASLSIVLKNFLNYFPRVNYITTRDVLLIFATHAKTIASCTWSKYTIYVYFLAFLRWHISIKNSAGNVRLGLNNKYNNSAIIKINSNKNYTLRKIWNCFQNVLQNDIRRNILRQYKIIKLITQKNPAFNCKFFKSD